MCKNCQLCNPMKIYGTRFYVIGLANETLADFMTFEKCLRKHFYNFSKCNETCKQVSKSYNRTMQNCLAKKDKTGAAFMLMRCFAFSPSLADHSKIEKQNLWSSFVFRTSHRSREIRKRIEYEVSQNMTVKNQNRKLEQLCCEHEWQSEKDKRLSEQWTVWALKNDCRKGNKNVNEYLWDFVISFERYTQSTMIYFTLSVSLAYVIVVFVLRTHIYFHAWSDSPLITEMTLLNRNFHTFLVL